MSNNMQTAQKTLQREAELRELQSEVQQLRTELRAAQEALAAKQARQQRLVSVRRSEPGAWCRSLAFMSIIA